MAASSWFGFHDYCMNDGILEELHSFYIFLQYKRVCLKIQPTLSIQFLQDGSKFSLSLNTQPPKKPKNMVSHPNSHSHARAEERVAFSIDRLFFLIVVAPSQTSSLIFVLVILTKLAFSERILLQLRKSPTKSPQILVCRRHIFLLSLAAMVFESLMGSAWAVIWLGRGKWAKRPTQLGGGFKHCLLSPCFAPIPGEMNDPIWRAYYIWVVQPPQGQFGTLQVSSCTVGLQILCIVCSDVMSQFSPVF